ncbi:FGGY family carbohydrate kinase [Amycolatopsis rhabdoformis]|uniref:FGGY family carbohydrate kinase n=1 Tax=Amycolatopsis rhabdoformis TaxID=1448059 RepID=A0ABZ1HW83_9PSEU|nr:FGGY family carbohydrate kinase [Amycolatopsis rhabdoformis]WSE26489.1 FGGY family carbohydrate kinase [Amycolatopsis rhabdoformis]
MNSNRLVLGIDIGTTAVKVAAFGVDGRLRGVHSVGYPIARPRPGWAEQDPEDWWRGCTEALEAVLAELEGEQIQAVGIVSQVNTHLLVDEHLRPLTEAVIWQDQRCAAVARELDARFTPEDKRRIWGGPVALDASFVGARAAWFARERPEEWARARWILGPKDFIGARLTGRVATDKLASVRVANQGGYLPEAVALVDGLGERLPELLEPEEVLGESAVVRAPVVVGTMDAFGAVFGTRTTEVGRGMISCGTSLVVAGASRRKESARGVVSFPPRNGLTVHAGPTQAAGDAVRWWAQASGQSVAEVFAGAAGGGNRVVFTPYLQGERAPLWDADVRGSFLGLTSAATRADLSRAVLTGVAFSARHVLEQVEEACGLRLPSLTFSGGGARSDLWTQLHADVLGRPIERLRVRDSAALGAALLGAVGVGLQPDVETAAAAAVHVERVFEPQTDLTRWYEAYRASYEGLAKVHELLRDPGVMAE